MCKELLNEIEKTIVSAVITDKVIKTKYEDITFQIGIKNGRITRHLSKTDLLKEDLIIFNEEIQKLFGYKSFSYNSSIKIVLQKFIKTS